MRYDKETVEKFMEALKQIPSIRYASKKAGIHPSTAYRWIAEYPEFHKLVEAHKVIGRDNISDLAESVIVNKIQDNDLSASKYWLSHNDERYVEVKRVPFFQYLERSTRELLSRREEDDPILQMLYHHYLLLEDHMSREVARDKMRNVLKAFFSDNYEEMIKFEIKYEEWKKGRSQDSSPLN